MKLGIITALVAIITAIIATEAPAQAGVGSCYEVRPLCMWPQSPLCICDMTQNCMWVCR
jgi:hypothetical protein